MLEHIYELAFFFIFIAMAYIYVAPLVKKVISDYIQKHNNLITIKSNELDDILGRLDHVRESYSKVVTLYSNVDQRLSSFRNENLELISTKQDRDIEALAKLERNRIINEVRVRKKKALLDLFGVMTDKIKEELAQNPLPIAEICTQIHAHKSHKLQ